MDNGVFVERNLCPGCNSEYLSTIYTCHCMKSPIKDYLEEFYKQIDAIEFDYLMDVEFVLQECFECGMIFQRYIPNDSLMLRIYEEWLNQEKLVHASVQKESLDVISKQIQEIQMVIATLGKQPIDLVLLDFGMGWGKWCQIAKVFGCQVFGTDLSPSRMAYAEACGVSVISSDKIHENKFDFINTEQVFEHLAAPHDTLVYLRDSLKP